MNKKIDPLKWNDGPPPAFKTVFAVSNRLIVRAKWIPRFTKVDQGSCEDDFGEYCEEDDCHYWPEGWYEWNSKDETHWILSGKEEPTHWMVLPILPSNLEVAS